MPASRNPFFIRTAEQMESDDQFLNLFGQSVLDILPNDGVWNRFLPIEGAPGSGKSTLLRLFTPTVLSSIENTRARPELHDLVKRLTSVDAIDSTGVQVLGVLVNCKEDYSRLADLGFESEEQHKALFKALLNSRVTLLSIRSALQIMGRAYPADVDTIQFVPREDSTNRPDSRAMPGRTLFDRARIVEELILNSLNSFSPQAPTAVESLLVDDFLQLLNSHRMVLTDKQTLATRC